MTKIKSLAVLCSGGDAPGMNCAIRAVVRSAIGNGIEIYGIKRGYSGLLEGELTKMDASSVGNIIQHGGTILQTSRCPEFKQEDTRREAAHLLRRKKIDGLVVIGGDGSFNGAWALHQEHGIPVAGIPGTIDNDIAGSDYTIGFDTAVSTAVEAVDKIRDTAHSHARTFIVEVMGRHSPAIALHVGVCTGAENVVLPADKISIDGIAADVMRGMKRGKSSSIIIVAEGSQPGILSYEIQQKLKEAHSLEAHVCVLGHIQRGGNPSPTDRFIASRMGNIAVENLLAGEKAIAAVYIQGAVQTVPLDQCLSRKANYLPGYIDMIKALSI